MKPSRDRWRDDRRRVRALDKALVKWGRWSWSGKRLRRGAHRVVFDGKGYRVTWRFCGQRCARELRRMHDAACRRLGYLTFGTTDSDQDVEVLCRATDVLPSATYTTAALQQVLRRLREEQS